MNQLFRGNYRDILIAPHGITQWDSGWHSNLIVDACNVLLAALMKRDERITGILYLAVGEGEKDWDSQRPLPSLTTSRLTNEVFRKAISEDQITYLDNSYQPIETPTGRLEVTVELYGEEMVPNGYQSLREFGLFGGDATEEPNSGFMIDYVLHPRIDLSLSTRLRRTVRLSFIASTIWQESLVGFGASLPVISVDGVGAEYAGALQQGGIKTLGDLAGIDPFSTIGNIPQVKLREFCAKARMVMRLRANLSPFVPLADHNIGNLLRDRPEDTSMAVGLSDITPEMIRNLQEELAVLQICLDDESLQKIKLGKLINP